MNDLLFLSFQELLPFIHHTPQSSSPPTLSTLNLSSNNFSKELANLASLTNSSDNTLENTTSSPLASSSAAPNPCDNQFTHHHSNDVVMDLSMSITAPSSVDSALCMPCNGVNTEAYLQNSSSQATIDEQGCNDCNAIIKSDNLGDNHQASSSASSTSSGNYSASTPLTSLNQALSHRTIFVRCWRILNMRFR